MPRATFLVLWTALLLVHSVHSLRDGNNETDTYSGVRMSVTPRSFHMAALEDHGRLSEPDGGAQAVPDGVGALAQLHDQHSVRPQEDSAVSQARSDVEDGEWGGVRAQARPSGDVKQSLGSSDSEEEKSDIKGAAKAKLREYVDSRQKWEEDALRLDAEMHQQYNALLGPGEEKLPGPELAAAEASGHHVATGLLSIEEEMGQPMSEDEQFDNLEKQTQHIMDWFQQLKQLRKTRDKLKAQSQAAVKAASDAGISKEDLKKVQSTSEGSKPKTKDESAKKASALMEKREHLAKVMASSAIEMAQLEKAAGDVTRSLDAYKSWKARDDGSIHSQAEAEQVKAKLDAAMDFLSEHENTIDKRRSQIDEMMRDAQL